MFWKCMILNGKIMIFSKEIIFFGTWSLNKTLPAHCSTTSHSSPQERMRRHAMEVFCCTHVVCCGMKLLDWFSMLHCWNILPIVTIRFLLRAFAQRVIRALVLERLSCSLLMLAMFLNVGVRDNHRVLVTGSYRGDYIPLMIQTALFFLVHVSFESSLLKGTAAAFLMLARFLNVGSTKKHGVLAG